MKIGARLLKLS